VPDIDLDFPRDIREKLIVRVVERYGSEHAALVASFATYRSRGAIRDVGKALGLPYADLERLARLTDGWNAQRVADEIAALPDAATKLRSPRWRAFGALCAEIAGLPRTSPSIPAGWSSRRGRSSSSCPVQPAAMEGRQMCQWDKDSCADAGFLKIDLLGLGMLSAVEECVDLIARTAVPDRPLARAARRPDVFAEIQQADTVGCFQIESRAQMQVILRTRPETIDDITVQVALVRPGPIQGRPSTRTSSGASCCATTRPTARRRPSAARGAAARDARRRRLPGPGARRRRPSRRLHVGEAEGCGGR
jgi:DNA polymerase III, alpha subunit